MSFDYLWRRCLVLSGCVLALAGCSPKEHDAIVASVAGQPITLSQYENQYLRNAPSRDSAAKLSPADRQHFLDLMVDYHLKLEDAKRNDLDNKPSVRNEIRQYKGGLTESYVTDKELIQPALHMMYRRRLEEVRARHILLALPPNASAQDSVKAYALAHQIIDSLKAGLPFDLFAKQYSIDPSAKVNGGDLYYFTGGTMVPVFEDAIYALKPGEISIVRTNYGLHIIQLVDREPSPGEIHCAHIMIRFPSTTPAPEDTVKALAQITKILDSLKQGVSFEDLAKRNSTDVGSASRGGDLGWFARRRWVQAFDEAAFKLKPGQRSGIVRSPYGYHIIECLGQRPVKSFDEMKQELSQQYQQARAQAEYNDEVNRLKKNLGFVLTDTPVIQFLATCDSMKSTHSDNWDSTLTPTLGRAVVFRAKGQTMTLDSIISDIKQHSDYTPELLRYSTFMVTVNKVAEQFVWTVAADSFATVYPEFAALLSDYRDGVVLYQMEQENVWNKITVNDSLLHVYYENNRQKFVWPERLDISELRMVTPTAAQKVEAKIKAGETFEQIVDEDSVRMKRPIRWQIPFKENATSLTAAMKKTLDSAGVELAREPDISISVTAHPDTGKGPNAVLPTKRLNEVVKYLRTTLKIDSSKIHIEKITLAPPVAGISSLARQRAEQLRQVDLNLNGKLPLVVSKPVVSLLAVNADERAIRADSLAIGQMTPPFRNREFYLIVRLNGRDPSHLKTFDEAQPEVSAAYQDFESEQLRDAWIKNLRAKYPVVEHPELLREAFAPTAQ